MSFCFEGGSQVQVYPRLGRSFESADINPGENRLNLPIYSELESAVLHRIQSNCFCPTPLNHTEAGNEEQVSLTFPGNLITYTEGHKIDGTEPQV